MSEAFQGRKFIYLAFLRADVQVKMRKNFIQPFHGVLLKAQIFSFLFKVCPEDFGILRGFILQSHYPNRWSPDGRRAKIGKIGRRRPIVGRRWHRFWKIFWSADDFFVEAPKLKVSLTDPPIFRGFVIGEASGDGRPMIGRRF